MKLINVIKRDISVGSFNGMSGMQNPEQNSIQEFMNKSTERQRPDDFIHVTQ